MGTNYYYHYCTNNTDRLHVGKSSGGWSFHFRAHRDQDLNIISIDDWAHLFSTVPGVLVSEYDRTIQDPLDFLQTLSRPSLEQQEKEDSPDWRGRWSPHPDPKTEWRDHEGFAFFDGEFC